MSIRRTDLHNKFHTTVSQSHRFRAEAPKRPGKGGNRRSKSDYGRSDAENYAINLADITEQINKNPKAAAKDAAYQKARNQRYTDSSQLGPYPPEELLEEPKHSRQDTELLRRAQRNTTWRAARGIYEPRPTPQQPNPKPKSPGDFMRDEMAPSHRDWLEDRLNDPNSEFNKDIDLGAKKTGRFTSGTRARLETYTRSLQMGESHEEALARVRRMVDKTDVGRPTTSRSRRRQADVDAERVLGARTLRTGRPTKFTSVAPSPAQFKFGIDSAARPGLDEIKKVFPDKSEMQLIQIQQAALENISQDMLANQKWAHETRRANLLGQISGRVKETPDRVTIFTTNLGHPTVSVPKDSLVGQYIIKKRKSVMGGYGVPKSQLKGEFPDAVRDAHIVDVATGVSVGLQGRQGAFNTTGYRFGRKASQGYGRPRPLGGNVLYDTNTGRPVYDNQGNIVYTDGLTRPVDYTTPAVGFRVLIG